MTAKMAFLCFAAMSAGLVFAAVVLLFGDNPDMYYISDLLQGALVCSVLGWLSAWKHEHE